MSSILYLQFLKIKSKIRIFLKSPFRVVLLIFAVIVLGAIIINLFSAQVNNKADYESFLLVYLLSNIFFLAINLAQPKVALVRESDANYILSGPYSDKEVIFFGMLESISGGFIFSLMINGYLLFLKAAFDVSNLDFLMMFLGSFLLFHILYGFIDFSYLRFKNNRSGLILRWTLFIVIALATLFSFYLYYQKGMGSFEIRVLDGFLKSEYVSYIPLLGALRDLLFNIHYGGNFWLPLMILVGLDVVLILVNLQSKIDPERIIMDASDIETMIKNKRNHQDNTKIKTKNNFKFKKSYLAISDRLLLDMHKTSSFISKGELGLIVVYFIICLLNRQGILYYQVLMIVALSFFAGIANFNDELKHHYIYMMPISDIKKLFAIIIPTILKTSIICFVMTMVALVFSQDIITILNVFLILFGSALSLIALNILCLRYANDSQLLSNIIKTICSIAVLFVFVIVDVVLGLNEMNYLVGIITLFINIVLMIILLYASKSIFKRDIASNVEVE